MFFFSIYNLLPVAIWHQYDGVVTSKKEKRWFSYSSSQKEEHLNPAMLFTHECLPQLFKRVQKEDESVNISEALQHMHMLLFGLNKTYVEGLQCWEKRTAMLNQVSEFGKQ